MKKSSRWISLLLAALFLFLSVGVFTFLHPCRHEDGSPGVCGDAGNALAISGMVGAAVAVLSVFLAQPKARAVLMLILLALSVFVLLIPGTVFPLCMMQTMRCQSVMKPAALLIGAGTFLLSLIETVRVFYGIHKEKRA